jgi:hypothetical protein
MILKDVEGTPQHTMVSLAQAGSLKSAIAGARKDMAPDQIAATTTTLTTLDWASDEHMLAVLHELNPPSSHEKLLKRRCMQDYLFLANYFPKHVWTILQDPTVDKELKLGEMLRLMCQLGLRTPSEQSIKRLASLWVVVSHEVTDQISIADRTVLHMHVKQRFDGLRKKIADPPEWCAKLPESASQFCQQFPRLAEVAYCDGMPIAPEIDMAKLYNYDFSYGCRGGAKRALAHAPNVPMHAMQQHTTSSFGSSSSGFEQQAMQFMQRMLGMVMSVAQQQQQGQLPEW